MKTNTPLVYREFVIERGHDTRRTIYTATHVDYDGPEDTRYFTSSVDVLGAIEEIDEYWDDQNDALAALVLGQAAQLGWKTGEQK